jgi:hypothetical protein
MKHLFILFFATLLGSVAYAQAPNPDINQTPEKITEKGDLINIIEVDWPDGTHGAVMVCVCSDDNCFTVERAMSPSSSGPDACNGSTLEIWDNAASPPVVTIKVGSTVIDSGVLVDYDNVALGNPLKREHTIKLN